MKYIYTIALVFFLFIATSYSVTYLTGSGAKLTDIPVDTDFTSNGLMKRTGEGVYGIATQGTDYYKPNGVDVSDADVSNDITLDVLRYNCLSSEPSSPAIGERFCADNNNWDPSNIIGTDNYIVVCTGTGPNTYTAIDSEGGNFFISEIAIPTLEEDEWEDEAGDRLLVVAEIKNKILSNGGLGAATHFDFPARSEDWNFIVMCEAAQNIVLDPNGVEQWYLNGTQTSVGGDNIQNLSCTQGESIACFSTERAVYCESKYPDWVEE